MLLLCCCCCVVAVVFGPSGACNRAQTRLSSSMTSSGPALRHQRRCFPRLRRRYRRRSGAFGPGLSPPCLVGLCGSVPRFYVHDFGQYVVVAVTGKTFLPSCYRAFWPSPNGGHTSCVYALSYVTTWLKAQDHSRPLYVLQYKLFI